MTHPTPKSSTQTLKKSNPATRRKPAARRRTAYSKAELEEIFRHTTRIDSFQTLETLPEYPAGVAKFLKRVSRVRIERLLYRIL